MKDEPKSKTVSVPGILVKNCEPHLSKKGFHSLSELIRDLLRDWSERMDQEEINRVTGQRFLQKQIQQQRKGDEIMNELVKIAKEGKHEELAKTILKMAGENAESTELLKRG